MKQKNRLKKFINFRFTDLTAVCEYLEDMAMQGWMLESMRTIAVFRKSEPKKVRYAVELLGSASAISHVISSDSQEYINMCEQAGWSFICNTGKMYIFCTESMSAPEIVTDSAEKLTDIKMATLKTNAIAWFFLPLIMLFNLSMQLNANDSLAVMAANYMTIISMLIYTLFFLTIILQMASFVRWYFKAKKSVNSGQGIPYVNFRQLKKRKLETTVSISLLSIILIAASILGVTQGDWFVAAFSLLLALFAVAIVFISHMINKQRLSAAGVIITGVVIGFALTSMMTFGIITLTLSAFGESSQQVQAGPVFDSEGKLELNNSSMPVSLSDLGITTASDEQMYIDVFGNKTILAAEYRYRSFFDQSDDQRITLSYNIYHSPFDFLRRSYINQLKEERTTSALINADSWGASSWGAREIYQLSDNEDASAIDYIIIYDEYVIKLFGDDITLDESLFNQIAHAFRDLFS